MQSGLIPVFWLCSTTIVLEPPACTRCTANTPTSANMAPSTLARIEALCSWLQAGGIALSGSELNSWREECKALAALLFLQDKMVQNIGASIHQITSPGRLRAMVSLLTSCIHSPDALAKLSYDAASNIHFKAVVWASCYLDIDPGNGCPSSSQLAVAEVLLRAKVLQGCSRLLASATAAVAASGQATQRVRRQCLTRKSDEEARELDGALSTISCLLPPLASLCGVLQPDSPAPLTGQRASPSTTPNRDGSEGQAHAMELGFERQRGKKGQEEGLQAREADPGGVGHVAQPAGLFQQLVAALYDSSVLEHVARSVLVQAGYVWRMQQAGRQHSLAYGQLYAGLTNLCGFFAAQYGDLVIRRGGPKMPGADSPESTASAQRDAGGAQAQAHRGEAAPPTPHQQHTSTPTPPLAASGHGLDAAHSLLLGRVLSGPCACHLALCQGLRTLCALDGGGDYGLPEEAGLQGLPPCVIPDDEEEEEQHSRHVRLAAGPLQNLVAVLAMRRGEPGAEAEVQPPGRGTRLQLTLRVAHAAGGAKPEAGSSGSGSSQRYVVDQAEAAPIAVYALRMAWRHMPPPGGRARADRRRAALRRWAAAAERVARAGVAIGAVSHPLFGRHMALILRLHPSYVGPLEGPGKSTIWVVGVPGWWCPSKPLTNWVLGILPHGRHFRAPDVPTRHETQPAYVKPLPCHLGAWRVRALAVLQLNWAFVVVSLIFNQVLQPSLNGCALPPFSTKYETHRPAVSGIRRPPAAGVGGAGEPGGEGCGGPGPLLRVHTHRRRPAEDPNRLDAALFHSGRKLRRVALPAAGPAAAAWGGRAAWGGARLGGAGRRGRGAGGTQQRWRTARRCVTGGGAGQAAASVRGGGG